MWHNAFWFLVFGFGFFGLAAIFAATPPVDRTEGLLGSPYAKSLPQAYVIYPEGFRSITMPIGNARSYAEIFGGTVVPVEPANVS